MSAEMKVVIVLKDGKAAIGVKSPDCDPLLTTVEGGLEQALARVPALAQEAQAKWSQSPQNPKTTIVTTTPAPARTSTQVRSATTSKLAEQTRESDRKPNLF